MQNTKHLTGKNTSNDYQPGRYEYYLLFDTETKTDETQALRFGVFELYGSREVVPNPIADVPSLLCNVSDVLIYRGLFYSQASLQDSELRRIQAYAKKHSLVCIPVEQFVKLFYSFAHNKDRYTVVIGHNLPFDLSRLAQEWQYPKGDFENGFSLKLCDCAWTPRNEKRSKGDSCKIHPSIKVKKISPKASIFEFADKKPRGCFVDTATIARALLGPGSTSLDTLGEVLNIEHKKQETTEHGGELTDEYLDYAVNDVLATWEVFCKLREIYTSYNFSQKLHYVFSEASLGKALYRELGIEPAMKRMENIPQEVHGYAMATYYGGRSEVHMRHEMVQVAYCDFKSQYPTIFELMGLQDLLLAESFEVINVRGWVDIILEHGDNILEHLQDKRFWRYLRILCKISGKNLILPVRAKFNGQSTNIALCNCELQNGTWYTLSDVLANLLLGGSMPVIEEAIEVVPYGKIETNSLEMFDGLVKINPSEANIFTTLINQRTRIKKQAKKATDGCEKEKLDRTQLALKLLANSTSYGINVEMRTEDVPGDVSVLLYGNDGCLHAASSEYQEAGTYYCPCIGCHIPAGGRLLLAIAQRLGADRGLSYAFCDTDSMSFYKPEDMAIETFYNHVDSIIKWFEPLYPYDDNGELFELEDVNYWRGERTELYFLGVSAKRYVLFNQLFGSFRVRKVSSHGLGAFRISDDYKSPFWIPTPDVPLKELGLTAHTRWIYDLWYDWLKLYEEFGTGEYVKPLWSRPSLDTPAYNQTVLNTAYLFKLFSNIPGIRPFNFVTTFFSFWKKDLLQRIVDNPDMREEYEKCVSSLYVPFTTRVNEIDTFYVIRSNEQVHDIKPLTVQEAIQGYFSHPEWKSVNGHFTGEMEMRHIKITGWIPQGKESSYEVLELEDSGLPTSIARECVDIDYVSREQWEDLKEQLREYGVNAIARKLDIPAPRLSEILASKKAPKQAILKRLKSITNCL